MEKNKELHTVTNDVIKDMKELLGLPLEKPKMIDELLKGELKKGEMIELYGYSGNGRSYK